MLKFFWFSYILWQFLLKILCFLLFDCSLDVISCLSIDLRRFDTEMLRRLDMNFLNILSLASFFWNVPIKPFIACIFYYHSFFKRHNIINHLNQFLKKIVVCLVYIIISLIIWEYNFAQSLFVLIYLIVFKKSNWNLVAVTYFFFFHFSLAKIFIDFLRPKVLQNSRYFFVSDDTLFAPFIMFFLSSPNVEPFWCKFLFRSPSICHASLNILSEFKLSNSISGNLVWSGGL